MTSLFTARRIGAIAPVLGASAALLSKNILFSAHSDSHTKGAGFTLYGSKEAAAATYNANDPSEDRCVYYEDGKEDGYRIAAVFDGHGGFTVSDYASKELIPKLINKLKADKSTKASMDDKILVEKAIIAAFQDVEDSYMSSARSAFASGYGKVANVGSCVGMAIKLKDRLVIANAGDCRSVLGSEVAADSASNGSGRYVATRLSRDHNARVPLEQVQLHQDHPREDENVVRCHPHNPSACYVKGRLQLTRSLGDLYLKHREFNAPAGMSRSAGRHIPEPFTPPYVRHVPDLTYIRLDKTDKFVIVASDGVWDFFSDEEAVQIVSTCIREGKKEEAAGRLVEATLRKAAEECGMSYERLLSVPPGRGRRGRHDDTTAVVMFF